MVFRFRSFITIRRWRSAKCAFCSTRFISRHFFGAAAVAAGVVGGARTLDIVAEDAAMQRVCEKSPLRVGTVGPACAKKAALGWAKKQEVIAFFFLGGAWNFCCLGLPLFYQSSS